MIELIKYIFENPSKCYKYWWWRRALCRYRGHPYEHVYFHGWLHDIYETIKCSNCGDDFS